MFSKLLHLPGSLPHRCSCWDLLARLTGTKGPCSRRSASAPFLNEHTLIVAFRRQRGRNMAMWEFSHSAGKACCANRLQVWALPNKHALGQSAHWSLSHSHAAAAAPEEPLLRCVNKSGENNPCGVKYFRPAVDLCQCCNLGLSFSHLSGHEPLATRDLRNRTRIPQGKRKKKNQKKKTSDVFQNVWVMSDGCSLFLSTSEKCAGKYLWHWHLPWSVLPSDVERSIQCQGDESLAMELIISITHGHMALSCHMTIARNITSLAVGVHVIGENVFGGEHTE